MKSKLGPNLTIYQKNQQIEEGDFDCVFALSRSNKGWLYRMEEEIFFSKLSEAGPVQHSGEDDKERWQMWNLEKDRNFSIISELWTCEWFGFK